MDRATVDYYHQKAPETAAKYRTVDLDLWRQRFAEAFPPGARVLDVGAGSGRDLALLLSLGFDAYGLEPAEGMCGEAVKAYSNLAGRLFAIALPIPEDANIGTFRGILCSAVLMHVPEAELFDAAFSLKKRLEEKGRLLISIPVAGLNLNTAERDPTGRLFRSLQPEYLVLLFERLGFELLQQWEDADRLNRPGVKWATFLFELNSSPAWPTGVGAAGTDE